MNESNLGLKIRSVIMSLAQFYQLKSVIKNLLQIDNSIKIRYSELFGRLSKYNINKIKLCMFYINYI